MNAVLESLYTEAVTLGGLYGKRDLFGSTAATEQQLAQERAYYNQMNGGGPVNQDAALNQAPMSIFDQIFGRTPPTNATNASPDAGMSLPMKLLILVGVGALGYWLWKKFS